MNSNGRLLLLGVIMIVILSVISYIIGNIFGFGLYGPIIGFEISIAIIMFIYFSGDGILLRRYRAKRVPEDSSIYQISDQLAERINIPPPRLFIADVKVPTLFAIGRNSRSSSIVITRSMMDLLDEEELGAVLAHEMYYIEVGEILANTAIAVVSGAFTSFTTSRSVFLGSIMATVVAPPAAFIIKFVIPESREHFADLKSVDIFRRADKLMSALDKIQKELEKGDFMINPSHAHLFIINPLHDKGIKFMGRNLRSYNKLFNTHPSVHDRLDILRSFRLDK
ncbi:MAG: M48 family metalloprotease [Halobacteriota archaeon]|nr:M48 family metalloprotease [Halobacteriota archaeon]